MRRGLRSLPARRDVPDRRRRIRCEEESCPDALVTAGRWRCCRPPWWLSCGAGRVTGHRIGRWRSSAGQPGGKGGGDDTAGRDVPCRSRLWPGSAARRRDPVSIRTGHEHALHRDLELHRFRRQSRRLGGHGGSLRRSGERQAADTQTGRQSNTSVNSRMRPNRRTPLRHWSGCSKNARVVGDTADRGPEISLTLLYGTGTKVAGKMPANVVDFRPLGKGDVALLKVDKHNLPSSELATDADVSIGTSVLAVGFPESTRTSPVRRWTRRTRAARSARSRPWAPPPSTRSMPRSPTA